MYKNLAKVQDYTSCQVSSCQVYVWPLPRDICSGAPTAAGLAARLVGMGMIGRGA